MFSRFIHVKSNDRIFFFSWMNNIPLYLAIYTFSFSFTYQWTWVFSASWLLWTWAYGYLFDTLISFSLDIYIIGFLGYMGHAIFNIQGAFILISIITVLIHIPFSKTKLKDIFLWKNILNMDLWFPLKYKNNNQKWIMMM
jgi:hypothetical protein